MNQSEHHVLYPPEGGGTRIKSRSCVYNEHTYVFLFFLSFSNGSMLECWTDYPVHLNMVASVPSADTLFLTLPQIQRVDQSCHVTGL